MKLVVASASLAAVRGLANISEASAWTRSGSLTTRRGTYMAAPRFEWQQRDAQRSGRDLSLLGIPLIDRRTAAAGSQPRPDFGLAPQTSPLPSEH